MTLDEYRAREGLNLSGSAARLHRPFTTVHGWLRGTRRPDWTSLEDIVAATGGAVSAADFAGATAPSLAQAQAPLVPVNAAEAKRPLTARERDTAPYAVLAAEALSLGLDPERIAREALADADGAERNRRWMEESRPSIEAWNRWHEKHGLPLEEYRMF